MPDPALYQTSPRVYCQDIRIACTCVLTIIFKMNILETIMMIRIREQNVDRSPRLTYLIRGILHQ